MNGKPFSQAEEFWGDGKEREDKTRWELSEGKTTTSGELRLRICIQLDLGRDSTTNCVTLGKSCRLFESVSSFVNGGNTHAS